MAGKDGWKDVVAAYKRRTEEAPPVLIQGRISDEDIEEMLTAAREHESS